MTPEHLACVGTNSQLVPITRAIESSVPVTTSGFLEDTYYNYGGVSGQQAEIGRN